MRKLFFLLSALVVSTLTFAGGYTLLDDKNTLQIKTESLQDRKVQKVRLHNGLLVYIVSDPHVDESAACMLFNVGSWHDPKEYQGCAHFTEHLTFLGSKKYPSEDGLMKRVRDRGGMVNAYTGSEQTAYMFSINHDDFKGVLDEFAHMFIDPLFNENGIERELNAVNQEFAMNMESDMSRFLYVIKELCNKDHPFSGFNCGNKETLQGIPRSAVKKFHKTYYGANNGHLVIYTKYPLDEITPYVAETFAEMPQAEVTPSPLLDPMLEQKRLGSTIYMQPGKDSKSLSLVWDLPPEYLNDFNFQTANLVAYALNGKGPTSLYMSLKNEGLIDQMSCSAIPIGKKAGLFACDFDLTNKGIKETQTIIDRFYEALAALKETGVPPYLFNEMRTMSKVNYEFQSRGKAFGQVSAIAEALRVEPIETYPLRTTLPTAYNGDRVFDLLSHLTPQKCVTFVVADKQLTGVTPEQNERWMHIPYTIAKNSDSRLAFLQSVTNKHALGIPKPNKFLPRSLDLLPTPEITWEDPQPLSQSSKGQLYYKQDTEYKIPCVSATAQIKTPLLQRTARSQALGALFSQAAYDALVEDTSQAAVAGLYASVSCSSDKVTVGVYGYTDKSSQLLQDTMQKVRHVHCTEERFTLYKETLIHSYEQQMKSQPYMVAHIGVQALTLGKQNDPEAVRDALLDISYDEYVDFQNHLFDKTYIEMMACGNLSEEQAYTLWNIVHDEIGSDVYPKALHKPQKMLTLTEGKGPFRYEADTPMLGNVAYLHIQCGKATHKAWAAHTLFGRILNTDFFDTLRTKQQTGYICNASSDDIESQLVHRFLVQSTTHDSNELLARFELFLEGYTKQFETLVPESRFEETKKSFLVQLNQPYTNLYEEAGALTQYAFNLEGGFERKPQRIKAVEKLTYDEFKQAAIAGISRSNTRRIAYLLNGTGSNELMEYKKLRDSDLSSIGSLVSWQE